MSTVYDDALQRFIPDLRNDWDLNRFYQSRIERNISCTELDIHLQLQTVKAADLTHLFNFPASGEENEPRPSKGLIATAEEYGIDASRLKNGLSPGF